jgi:hypothetical protein
MVLLPFQEITRLPDWYLACTELLNIEKHEVTKSSPAISSVKWLNMTKVSGIICVPTIMVTSDIES